MKESAMGWGFHGHKLINRQAIFSLPNTDLLLFFKTHADEITSRSVNADKRRYAVETEACRHYIDFEAYQKDSFLVFPKYYSEAVKIYSEDSLLKHGTLPWNLFKVQKQLTKAMREGDITQVIALAADLGHYVGDANVPLHTTRNYDGQLTNQKGIHALWETRLPELFAGQYDYLVGRAEYVTDVQAYAWRVVYASHAAVDSVLSQEAYISAVLPLEHKYSFEERNGLTLKVYSAPFSERYALALQGQVERQLKKAIKMTADLWYTSWVDAGQPNLIQQGQPKQDPATEEDHHISNERFLESFHSCGHDHSFQITHHLNSKP